MRSRSTICALLTILLLPAAALATDDDASRVRRWGLGWDEGLTLRRWFGTWELGLVAGPDDWLDESDARVWDTDEPDSLQGRDDRHTSYQRESGFVRLRAAHRLGGEGPLDFMGQGGVQYRWRDQRTEYDYYYGTNETFEQTDTWTETWTLTAGIGLAWRPLAALSVETSFRLAYSWSEEERISTYVYRDLTPPLESDRTEITQTKSSTRRFVDQGWNGLGSLSFIFWF